ncbi:MAG: hypothetical protein RLZZ436_1428 [Planctomycetota bacterium]|jgi:hypothetical protein
MSILDGSGAAVPEKGQFKSTGQDFLPPAPSVLLFDQCAGTGAAIAAERRIALSGGKMGSLQSPCCLVGIFGSFRLLCMNQRRKSPGFRAISVWNVDMHHKSRKFPHWNPAHSLQIPPLFLDCDGSAGYSARL